MKIYKPKKIDLIKCTITSAISPNIHYITFDDCTLLECVDNLSNFINNLPIEGREKLSRKTQLISREYTVSESALKTIGKTTKNGKSKSISTNYYTVEEINFLLMKKYFDI